MNFLEFQSLDQESIEEYKNRAAYLLDVAQEYELDNPKFAENLRQFRNEKIARINELIHEILEEVNALDDYVSYVER